MNSPATVIPFVKASACGNDFLIIDGIHAPADLAGFSQRICERHQGVGADGVEWLFPAEDADVQARLFNADGSEAEISGNGTRCVGAYLCSQQARERIVIRTGAGLKTTVIDGTTVLTNAKGFTLYSFAPDTPTVSKCYGSCAAYWPPVTGTAPASSGLPGTVGTITRTGGARQLTYNGHPLYTYIGDSAPGQANGNNLNLNGGLWHEVPVSR